MYIAVVTYNEENRITKFKDGFNTQTKANDFVDGLDPETFPDAFAAEYPAEGADADWLVDPVAKTISYSPDLSILKARINSAVYNIQDQKILNGIVWSWSAEEPDYVIMLTPRMREVLSSWYQFLNLTTPISNPHGGFIKSNGVIIKGPGDIDIPDAAVLEICEFAGLWVGEISRIAIATELLVEEMDLAQLQAYDPETDIDWSLAWPGHSDWVDNHVDYNP